MPQDQLKNVCPLRRTKRPVTGIADEQGIDTDVDGWEDEVENFIEEKRQELLSEWLQEKLEELQAISFE